MWILQEPHVPGWSRLTSGISDTNYFIEGLRPTQDYQFRVKAETQYGVSDPTLPVSLDRPKGGLRKHIALTSHMNSSFLNKFIYTCT